MAPRIFRQCRQGINHVGTDGRDSGDPSRERQRAVGVPCMILRESPLGRLTMQEHDMKRRTFVQAAVAGALAPQVFGQAAKPAPKKMVGIQIGMASFAKPDYEKVLDLLQDKACVNTLFVKTLDYPGRADQSRFRGGNSTLMHAQYYKDTVLKPEIVQAPSVSELDVFARLIPADKKRGMKTFCWVSQTHSTRDHAPNAIDDVFWERDINGKVAGDHPAGPCPNNPNYRNFVLGLFEDYARSNDIDGVLRSEERRVGKEGRSRWSPYH